MSIALDLPTLPTPSGRILRAASTADADGIADLEAAPEQRPFVMAWDARRHRDAMANPNFRYFVLDGETRPRGYAFLAGFAQAGTSIEIGRLVVDGHRFGVGGDILLGIVSYVFETLGAHRLWTDTFDDNVPVRRLGAHYGFVTEGILRDAVYFGGRYRSVVFLALLEHEARAVLAKRRAKQRAGCA